MAGFHLYAMSRINKSTELERRARRLRGQGMTARGYRIALGVDKSVLISVMVAQLYECIKSH